MVVVRFANRHMNSPVEVISRQGKISCAKHGWKRQSGPVRDSDPDLKLTSATLHQRTTVATCYLLSRIKYRMVYFLATYSLCTRSWPFHFPCLVLALRTGASECGHCNAAASLRCVVRVRTVTVFKSLTAALGAARFTQHSTVRIDWDVVWTS